MQSIIKLIKINATRIMRGLDTGRSLSPRRRGPACRYDNAMQIPASAGMTRRWAEQIMRRVVVVVMIAMMVLSNVFMTNAATYTFTQTNWSGGATANDATHDTANNRAQQAWQQFSSSTPYLNTTNDGADLRIGTTTYSLTQTSNATTTSGFSYGDFSNSSTTFSGSADGTSVMLATQTANVPIVTTDDTSNIATQSQQGGWGYGTYTNTEANGVSGSGSSVRFKSVVVTPMVSAGHSHSLALKNDGTVWAWGLNGYGQLGDGTFTQRIAPMQVKNAAGTGYLTGIVAISAGWGSSLALKNDGTVWAWGANSNGQLGDGTTTDRSLPVQVKDTAGTGYLTGITAISVGDRHSLAVKNDGTVWAWGLNGYSQLGDNTTTQRNTPVQVKNSAGTGYFTGATAVKSGHASSFVLKNDGTVWAWGRNSYGDLGDNSTTNRSLPVQVKDTAGTGYLTGITAIDGSFAALSDSTFYTHLLALKSDGTVWNWGNNSDGQLGDGTLTQRNTPVQVKDTAGTGYLTGVISVSGGPYHSLAAKNDGTAWSWGNNGSGRLGDATITYRNTPVQVRDTAGTGYLTGVISVSGGRNHSLALKSDGTVWAWAGNANGQIGDGTTTTRLTPVQTVFYNYLNIGAGSVSAGGYHSLYLKSDGTVWAVGDNRYGALGDNSVTQRNTPVQVKDTAGTGYLANIIAVSSGDSHSLALKSDGTVWAWGANSDGRLGDGTQTQRNTPTQVKNAAGTGYLTGITAISAGLWHSMALKSDGTVWAWGNNGYGRLGNGGGSNAVLPVQVKDTAGTGYLTGITAIDLGAGYFSLALRNDGTMWAWGVNTYGQLGDGTTVARNTPVQVKDTAGTGYLTGIVGIAEGGSHSVALKNDGTVWAFGFNDRGQLGDNTMTNRSLPAQVKDTAGTGYLTGVSSITSGDYYVLALKNDGGVWAWGGNPYGTIGDNTTTQRNTPVLVRNTIGTGYLTGVTAVSAFLRHSLALKSDGTVWAWGNNGYGPIGDNTVTQRNTPVQPFNLGYIDINEPVAASYYTSGTYTSYIDAGSALSYDWTSLAYAGQYPSAGTTVSIKVKGSTSASAPSFASDACDSGAVSANGSVALSASCAPTTSRYLWYQVSFSNGGVTSTTPSLDSITGSVTSYNGYNSSGAYTSGIIDMGLNAVADWGNVSWTNSGGQTVSIKVRTGNASDLSDATEFSSIESSTTVSGTSLASLGAISGHRYLQYQATLSTASPTQTPSLDDVTFAYTSYTQPATLLSSKYDTSSSDNQMGSLLWTEDDSLPAGTGVAVSLRTASTSALIDSSTWYSLTSSSNSCTKTNGIVSCPSEALSYASATLTDGVADQWYQYKIGLTSSGAYTPTLPVVNVLYVVNAQPEVTSVSASQIATSTDANWGKVAIGYSLRDIDTNSGTNTPGFAAPSFEYSTTSGSTWAAISPSSLASGNTDNKAVSTSTYNTYSAIWDAGSQLGSIYIPVLQIRVTANDHEAANNFGRASSNSFAFDRALPTGGGLTVDAGTANQANSVSIIVKNVSDNSSASYRLSDATTTSEWTTLLATTTVNSWVFDSAYTAKTLRVQYMDNYGNMSPTTTVSGPPPIDPSLFFIQDVTKLTIGDYRLYIGWATSSALDFASYKVEYATSSDNASFGSYANAYNVADISTAYFVHPNLSPNLYYKYRISIVDSAGNTSLRSGFVTAKPDGAQNFGEGGGGSIATAATVTNILPTQDTANATISTLYTLTDSSLSSKTNPSYEGYLLYAIGSTVSTSDASTITVSNASKLPAVGFVQINNEVIGYSSKSGAVLSGLTRGTWPTAATSRATRQNISIMAGTPVWIVATSTGTTITNTSITSGQSGTLSWNTLLEPALAGSLYSNVGIRVLVHDNQSATAGPITTQSDLSDDGILAALDLSAPTVQFATSSASAPETASASTTVTTTLSKPYALVVSTDYTTGGTAVLNTDYLIASSTATLTFVSGTTTATLSIQPLANGIYGPDKTVILTLSSPSNATLGSVNPFTFTITEDSAQPTIAFATSTGSGSETTSSVSIPVTLSVASSATTTVSYVVSESSTAVSGTNYTLDAGTVSFAAGTTTASIPLTIVHDNAYSSPDRTVIVALSNPSGAALGATTAFTYTIVDADLIPQVNFTLASSTVAETGATTTITATLSYPSNQEILIPVSVNMSSTAVSGTNYLLATSTITFAAGTTTSSLQVSLLHDPSYSVAKTLVLSLGSADGITLGASTTHTLSITEVDNAAPEITSLTAGQVTSSTDANFGNVLIAYSVRDANTSSGLVNPTFITPSFEYNSGLGWNAITSLRAGDASNKSVADDISAPYTAIWNVRAQLGSVSLTDVQVRITANDNEGLNGIGRSTSTTFTIDTEAPQASQFRYDGRTGSLTLSISDANTITYTISNNANLVADGTNAESGIATVTGTSMALSLPWTIASTSPTIYLSLTDSFGNSATTSRSIPETVSGVAFYDRSDATADIYKEFITWNTYSATSTPFAYYTVYRSIDGGSTFTSSSTIANSGINYYIDANLSTSTVYAYKLTVTDTAGTVSAYSATVSDQPDGRGSTDFAAPVITSTQAASVQNTSATITWTTDEISDSTVEWGATTAYGSAATSSSLVTIHSATVTGLTPNTAYVFRVKSKDASGNEATDDSSGTGYAFTTGGGPSITSISAITTDRSATIIWTTNKTGTATVRYSKNSSFNGYNDVSGTVAPVGDASTTAVFTNTVSITGLESGAYYWYRVQSTDAGSNETIDNNGGLFYTFQTLSDTYAPAISNISTPITTSASVIVFWKTDELASSQVDYDPTSTTSFARSSALDTTLSIYHSVMIPDLSAKTSYNYRVRSVDAFGNSATATTTPFTTAEEGDVRIITIGGGGSGAGQFTTPPEVKDTTPPEISAIEVATTTAFSAIITFTTSEPTIGFVQYGKTSSYGEVSGESNYGTTHSIKLSGLRMGTEYHFHIQSRDKSANAATSEDITFKTRFLAEGLNDLKTVENAQQFQDEIEQSIESILPSLFPPFVEDARVTDITESSATIFWRTNVRAYGVVSYGDSDSFAKATASSTPYTAEVSDTNAKTVEHTIPLIGLKPNTTYHFKAKSFSLPQVVGEGRDMTFITKAPAVQASIVDVKTTSFRAAWTTDVPASSLVEYKNLATGVINRIVNEPLATYHDILVDNLKPGTHYEVKALGYSESGNLLTSGSAINVLTSTDIGAPKISNFKVDGALVPGRTDRIQTIVSWTTDEPGTGIVEYQEGAGSVVNGFANKVTITDSYVTNHAVILTRLKPGTIYQFKITSSDQAGNKASFGPRTIITPQKGESIFDVIFKNFEDTFKFLRGAGQ